jgi:hypothetical protein
VEPRSAGQQSIEPHRHQQKAGDGTHTNRHQVEGNARHAHAGRHQPGQRRAAEDDGNEYEVLHQCHRRITKARKYATTKSKQARCELTGPRERQQLGSANHYADRRDQPTVASQHSVRASTLVAPAGANAEWSYFRARVTKKMPAQECQMPALRMSAVTARPTGPNSYGGSW